jgi:hypothetical protein
VNLDTASFNGLMGDGSGGCETQALLKSIQVLEANANTDFSEEFLLYCNFFLVFQLYLFQCDMWISCLVNKSNIKVMSIRFIFLCTAII